ncbi:hypothetical protein J4558_00180 [Leptolyngbya sp. 15MV]|nr:hypothetical protein J4558_00180 [Leptolyngbya sp. 15MV]
MWYVFEAYNWPTRIGWTQDPAVAEAACRWLNRQLTVNLYAYSEVDPDAPAVRRAAADPRELICDDDTRVGDFGDDD